MVDSTQEVHRNDWRATQTVDLLVKDFKIGGHSPRSIIGENLEFFDQFSMQNNLFWHIYDKNFGKNENLSNL